MTTPSTGAPQPPETGKEEDVPDPVEAVEAAAYEPADDENLPDDDPETTTYRPVQPEAG